jgi:hypothetical protein
MNKFILNVMNRKNLTIKQCEDNSNSAYTAADWAVGDAATYAAYAADAYSALTFDLTTEHWLNEYFKETGESRADYEAELERDNSFREVS